MHKAYLLMNIIVKMEFFRKGKGSALRVLLFVLAIPIAVLVYNLTYTLFKETFSILSVSGNEPALLGLIFLVATGLLIVTTFIPAINTFYLSDSIEGYLPLPLKPSQIIIGKSASPLLRGYVWNTVITAPFLLMYMLQAGSGFLFFLYAFIIWTIFPILPFLLVSSLLMFVMRFINISRYKDRAKAIGGLLSFALILAVNVLVRQDSPGDDGSLSAVIGDGELLAALTGWVPNAKLAAMALASPFSVSGILALTGLLIMTASGTFLFLYFSDTLYFKGVRGLSGGVRSSSSKRNVARRKSMFHSLARRDIKTIVRTPVYVTQILGHQFFAPLLLLIFPFVDGGSSFSSWTEGAAGLETNVILPLLLAFSALIGATSTAGTSSFSREGKTLYEFRSFPIPFTELLKSKLLVAFIIPASAFTLFALTIGFVFSLPFPLWAGWLVLSYVLILSISIIATALDMNEPKLTWESEEEVFQHRFINLLLLIVTAVFTIPVLLLMWKVPVMQNPAIAFLFGLSSFSLYAWTGWKIVKQKILPSFVNRD
ncbi:putative ABC transporter permease subunit [Salimicrobium salexigens]|uniref:ABC-2 type transport system permease protein n=1 Tax=Salimicrobium salexigens TaxID=908941 RepID=A0ABY1KK47_9BACI|nr:hypothetical protein [Salimicrobium salexigens]SIS44342.1 ABC-2 type transport system permease protein [Salimicrobium salexigens]